MIMIYMCIYIIHACIHMHIHIHIHIHTYTHTHIHTYITLHYIALHCIALHYITLHYIHAYIHPFHVALCTYTWNLNYLDTDQHFLSLCPSGKDEASDAPDTRVRPRSSSHLLVHSGWFPRR